MTWYRADTGRHRHRKIRKLARALDVHRMHAIGLHDVLLAMAADTGRVDGVLEHLDAQDLAEDCGFEGDPARLLEAFVEVGLIDRCDGQLRVHDFEERAGSLKEQHRKAAYRARARDVADDAVVPSSRSDPETVALRDAAGTSAGHGSPTDGRTDGRTNVRSERETIAFPKTDKRAPFTLPQEILESLERRYEGLDVPRFLCHMAGKAERGELGGTGSYAKSLANWCAREQADERSPFRRRGDPGPSQEGMSFGRRPREVADGAPK